MRTFVLALTAAALIMSGGWRPRDGARPGRPGASTAGSQVAGALSRARPARRGRLRRRATIDPMVAVHVAHLTAIGLAAGLTGQRALEFCAGRGPEPARAELVSVLRRAAHHGLASVGPVDRGSLGPFLTVLAGAIRSGAPQEPLIRAYARETRAAIVADRITRARRLPAQLAIPLALLLLPGFVLMVMGPTVLAIAERMLVPFSGR